MRVPRVDDHCLQRCTRVFAEYCPRTTTTQTTAARRCTARDPTSRSRTCESGWPTASSCGSASTTLTGFEWTRSAPYVGATTPATAAAGTCSTCVYSVPLLEPIIRVLPLLLRGHD